MNIEQAIFGSIRTAGGSGYRLLARSAGILEADAQELSVWGPSHDALGDSGDGAVSVNLFPLPSGAACLSRTLAAGAECSGRGGQHVYTQCFVLERAALARFAHNPFAVLKALTAQGSVNVCETPAETLPRIPLVGRAAVLDVEAVTQVQRLLGAESLAALVQGVLADGPVGVVLRHDPRPILAALLNCLPAECRGEFSFTTGLRCSPQRPFRWCALSAASNDGRRLERVYGLRLVDVEADNSPLTHPWARLLCHVLQSGRLAELRQHFTVAHPGLTAADLSELGGDLLALFERTPAARPRSAPPVAPLAHVVEPQPQAVRPGELRLVNRDGDRTHDARRRADGVHVKFAHTQAAQQALQAAAARVRLSDLATDPADVLGAVRPEAQARLELLDDTVFEAIAGKAEALDRLQSLWPQVLRELGPELVEESQLQYLRHALHVWRNYTDGEGDAAQASRALEVLCLLMDDRVDQARRA